MLLVNLLPEDRRPTEHTPLPRLLSVIGGVLISMVELAVIVFIFWVNIPDARRQKQELDEKLGMVGRLRGEIAVLTAEQADYGARMAVIKRLYGQRIRWAPKLSALSNPRILPRRVWLKSLKIEKESAGAKLSNRYFVIEGWARGDTSRARIEAITQFAQRLESDELFFADFAESLSEDLQFKEVEFRGGTQVVEDAPKIAHWFKMRARFRPPAKKGEGSN